MATYLAKPTFSPVIGPQGDGIGTRFGQNGDVVPLPAPENTELPYSAYQFGGKQKSKRNRKRKHNRVKKGSKKNKYNQSGGSMFPDINNFARVIGGGVSNLGTAWKGTPPYPSPLPWKQPVNAKTTILSPSSPDVSVIKNNADKSVADMQSPGAAASAAADGADASAGADGADGGAGGSAGAGAGAGAGAV